MSHDLRCRHTRLHLQEARQLAQAGHLLRRRTAAVLKISDQTDADAMLVVLRVSGVSPRHLIAPAISDLNLSVARIRSVADDEMITQSIPALGAMPLVELTRRTRRAG